MKQEFLIFVILFCCGVTMFAQKPIVAKYKPVVINVLNNNYKPGDSIFLQGTLMKYGIDAGFVKIQPTLINSNFTFVSDPIKTPSKLQLGLTNNKVRPNPLIFSTLFFQVEPGDTVTITKNGSGISYDNQNGQARFLRELNDIGTKLRNLRWRSYFQSLPTKQDYVYLDSVTYVQLAFLKSIRKFLSSAIYAITKVNLISANQALKRDIELRLINKDRQSNVRIAYHGDDRFPDIHSIKDSLSGYQDPFADQLKRLVHDASDYIPYSNYSGLIKLTYYKDSCIILGRSFNLGNYYQYLKSNFNGLLRETLLVNTIFLNADIIPDRGYYVNDALSIVKNRDFRQYLAQLKSGVPGDNAYLFELEELGGTITKQSALKGKIVILDFWFTGCTPCMTLHPKFDSIVDYFSGRPDVVFVSVNVDKDRSQWRESALSGKYTSTNKHNLLNVFGGTAKTFFEMPIVNYYNIQGCPTVLLIDQKGIIQNTPIRPDLDNGNSLITEIEGLLRTVL